MNIDFRKFMYTALIAFVMMVWISIVYISACGLTLTCHQGERNVVRTPVPTLAAVTLPAPDFSIAKAAVPTETAVSATEDGQVPRPSNPGGSGDALNLTGDATSGAQIFQTNCVPCHGPEGTQGVVNPGTDDGTVPTLNPIDPALVDPDLNTFAYNLDLFIQHGSTPAGPGAAISMPAWGDSGALDQQQIADVIAYLISLNTK